MNGNISRTRERPLRNHTQNAVRKRGSSRKVMFTYNALNSAIPVGKKRNFCMQINLNDNKIQFIYRKISLFTTLLTGLHFAFWESYNQNRSLSQERIGLVFPSLGRLFQRLAPTIRKVKF